MSRRVNSKVGRFAANQARTNVLILPESEVQSIRTLADTSRTIGGTNDSLQEFKNRVQSRSKDRAAAWTNTIDAVRSSKASQREAEEESRRQELEPKESEAEVSRRRRADAVRQAEELAFLRKDNVKQFHSHLLLATVLEERAQQVALRARINEREIVASEREGKELAESLRVGLAEDRREQEDRAARLRAQAAEQKAQLAASVDAFNSRRRAERAEGLRILKDAQQAQREEAAAALRRRTEARELAARNLEDNNRLRAVRMQEKEREKLEDEKIAAQAAVRSTVEQLRRDKEEAKHKRELERRQQLIAEQAQVLANLQDESESRLQRQINEAEVRIAERIANDRTMREAQRRDLEKQRAAQMKRAQRIEQQRKDDEARMKATWKRTAEEMALDELEERMTLRNQALAVSDFQKAQAAARKAEAERQKALDRERVRLAMEAETAEEAAFNTYVEVAMDEFESGKADNKVAVAAALAKRTGFLPKVSQKARTAGRQEDTLSSVLTGG